ncbi:uncharacterized protein LOC103519693 [Diaphorina citri]|uniref:Uncharacterized protein LOC103519693 n=1 Tax=Diaphorina citri TaxID=121845 RepID=A0A1S3DJ42_DIACI|nr:uncharacterized protein LOC103519693 [Diaphorina citri]
MNHDLKFNAHYQYVTNKAFKTLGFLYRNTKEFKNPASLKTLYCSLVRSSLEYCSTLWSPGYQTYIHQIESVQRKFLRMLNFKLHHTTNNINYQELMKTFNIQTLQHRRDVADVVFLLKLIKNEIKCADVQGQLGFRTNNMNTRNKDIFTVLKSKTNIAQNSPLSRCMTLCNILANPPFNIDVLNESPASIKSKLLSLPSLHQVADS